MPGRVCPDSFRLRIRPVELLMFVCISGAFCRRRVLRWPNGMLGGRPVGRRYRWSMFPDTGRQWLWTWWSRGFTGSWAHGPGLLVNVRGRWPVGTSFAAGGGISRLRTDRVSCSLLTVRRITGRIRACRVLFVRFRHGFRGRVRTSISRRGAARCRVRVDGSVHTWTLRSGIRRGCAGRISVILRLRAVCRLVVSVSGGSFTGGCCFLRRWCGSVCSFGTGGRSGCWRPQRTGRGSVGRQGRQRDIGNGVRLVGRGGWD